MILRSTTVTSWRSARHSPAIPASNILATLRLRPHCWRRSAPWSITLSAGWRSTANTVADTLVWLSTLCARLPCLDQIDVLADMLVAVAGDQRQQWATVPPGEAVGIVY